MTTSTIPNLPSPTILAVDDDQMVLRLLASVLRSAGFRVLTASGGRSAIEAYESLGAPIQLLLTDVVTPDLSGPLLAETLCTRQPDLQVLFISGFPEADFAPGQHFPLLPKPFTAAGLLHEVRHSLCLPD